MIEINGAYANAIVYKEVIIKKRRLYKVLKYARPEGLAYDEE